MGQIDDKVAFVTGAGFGIGRATAALLACEGAQVVVADVTGAEEEAASTIGNGAVAVHADVSTAADVEAMVATAVSLDDCPVIERAAAARMLASEVCSAPP